MALNSSRDDRAGAHPCHCAGVGGSVKTVSRDKQTGEIKEYPLENFERIIQVNLIGTFRCITKSAAGMLTLDVLPDGDRGTIVNTASVAAEDGQIGQAAYTASKAGIVAHLLGIVMVILVVGCTVVRVIVRETDPKSLTAIVYDGAFRLLNLFVQWDKLPTFFAVMTPGKGAITF